MVWPKAASLQVKEDTTARRDRRRVKSHDVSSGAPLLTASAAKRLDIVFEGISLLPKQLNALLKRHAAPQRKERLCEALQSIEFDDETVGGIRRRHIRPGLQPNRLHVVLSLNTHEVHANVIAWIVFVR